jgi:hypothetical protein
MLINLLWCLMVMLGPKVGAGLHLRRAGNGINGNQMAVLTLHITPFGQVVHRMSQLVSTQGTGRGTPDFAGGLYHGLFRPGTTLLGNSALAAQTFSANTLNKDTDT